MERIEGLVAEGRDIRNYGYRTAYAFSDGKALEKEYETWQATLRREPYEAPTELTPADEATIAHIVAGWARQPAEVS